MFLNNIVKFITKGSMYTHIHCQAVNSKFPNREILGAQYLSICEKSKLFHFSQREKLVACGTCALLEHSPALYMYSVLQCNM